MTKNVVIFIFMKGNNINFVLLMSSIQVKKGHIDTYFTYIFYTLKYLYSTIKRLEKPYILFIMVNTTLNCVNKHYTDVIFIFPMT